MSIVHIAFYPSDWLAGTRGLSDAEAGVYINLICRMYEMAGPIERDDNRLARHCGCKSKSSFVKSLEYLISEGKIIQSGNELFNERVQKEIKNTTEKSSKAKSAAQSRWDKKANKNNDSTNANASPEHMPDECQSEPESEPYISSPLNAGEKDVNEDNVNRMLEALGVTDETKTHGLLVWTEIFRWFENGCDLEKDILPVLKAKAAQGHKATNWAYFTKAIFQAKANRTAPPPTVEAKPAFQPYEDAVDRRRRKLKEKQQQEAGNVH